MLEFIRLLRTRYQSVLNHIAEHDAQKAGYTSSVHSLILAEACLQRTDLIQANPDLPIQVVIIGPTQAGKSTVVNLLVQNEVAEVSPLAGFTVHPHGVCFGIQETELAWLNDFFPQSQQSSADTSASERFNSFDFSQATKTQDNPFPSCVIWDTPDFDSIDAEGYRDGVLRTAALGDVIVLVVSKDKYADQSVWDMMKLLELLAQPTVICVNKISEQARPILIDSLLEKWRSVRNDPTPVAHTLSYGNPKELMKILDQERIPLVKELEKVMGKIKRKSYHQKVGRFVKSHWTQWIEPVSAEHNAWDEWNSLVDKCIDNGLNIYQRDYLDHPQHNETFQRALAELLSLLEIPGVASALLYARRVVTWPLRQVMKLGTTIPTSKNQQVNPTQEVMILNQVADHFLIQLSESVLDKIEEAPDQEKWWRQITAQLRIDKTDLASRFQLAADQYHEAFRPEIENAAQHLYQRLESQPAVLNSLRATRITTDAAAVALAVKTGGIGLHDFVITPAVLSITSLLTESALGGYMNKIAADLKQRQYQQVKNQLFDQLLRDRLYRLPEKLEHSDKFNISKQTLAAAEKDLNDKRYG